MYHVILRAARQGNPVSYQTFTDEGLNRTLKRVLRLCHQQDFEMTGMMKLELALSRTALRQRLTRI